MRIAAAALLIFGATSAAAMDFTIETVKPGHRPGILEIFLMLHPTKTADIAFLECFALVNDRAVASTTEVIRGLDGDRRVRLTFLNAPDGVDGLDCSLRSM